MSALSKVQLLFPYGTWKVKFSVRLLYTRIQILLSFAIYRDMKGQGFSNNKYIFLVHVFHTVFRFEDFHYLFQDFLFEKELVNRQFILSYVYQDVIFFICSTDCKFLID